MTDRRQRAPIKLSGIYRRTALTGTALTFTATADGSTVDLIPFYDAHDVNHNVYWNVGGGGVPTGWVRIANVTTNLVLDSGGNVASGSVLKQWRQHQPAVAAGGPG